MAQTQAPTRMVDLNSASVDEIAQLHMVGRERAADLVRHRPFRSWQDIGRVPGFSIGMIENLKNSGATIDQESGGS
ncbi:MAG TPA: helix-hairpin-helix domain-containing protein [Alphaproteobacteria bacterium]